MNPICRTALRAAVRPSPVGLAVAVPRQQVAAFAVRAGALAAAQKPASLAVSAGKLFTAQRPAQILSLSRQFSQTARVAEEQAAEEGEEKVAVFSSEQPEVRDCFVRNLSYDVTEADMKEAFEQYGDVTRVKIAMDNRGMSRGFGFVGFKTNEQARAACEAANESFWQGRQIGVALSEPQRTSTRSKAHPPKNEPTKSIFVGNVPYESTDVELNDFFRKLKGVKEVRVAVDRNTGWPRGFAHIDFHTQEASDEGHRVLSGCEFGGRYLRVDYAKEARSQGRERWGDRERSEESESF